MSRSDSDAGSSLRDSPLTSARDTIAPEADERQRGPIWLLAIGCSLLAGVALLFTSPPVISSSDGRSKRRRKAPAKAASAPTAVKEEGEPHREPWWLIAFTALVVVGIGLLLIFYAQLPPFLRF